jgi:hypothetical protein
VSIILLTISAAIIILIAVVLIVGMTFYLIGFPLTKLTTKKLSAEAELEQNPPDEPMTSTNTTSPGG